MKRPQIIKIGLAFIVFSLMLSANAYTRDIDFKIELSKDKIPPGRQVEMNLYFYDSMDIPAPSIPYIEGLEIRYKSSSMEAILEGNQTVNILKHIYSVAPLKIGKFRIGPLTFSYKDNKYISKTVFLEVSKDAGVSSKEIIGEPGKMDISDRIFMEVDIPRTDFYVNEKISVLVKFYTDWLDVENLEISDEPSKEYITEKYAGEQPTIVMKDGMKYAVLPFRKSFFILEPGKFTFGPVKAKFQIAKAKAELLNNNGTFYNKLLGARDSRSMEIEIPSMEVIVKPLPSRGRPADFRGAIGAFNMEVTADAKEVKIGDPITLTMKITGKGNYGTVKAPVIKEIADISTYEPQGTRDGDSMVFTQIIKAKSYDLRSIPEISFSYFDPAKGEYETVTKGPIQIKVIGAPKPAKKAEVKPTPTPPKEPTEKEELGTGIIYIKDSPGKLEMINPYAYKGKGTIFLGFFPVLLFIGAVIAQKRISLLEADTSYAGWLAASRRASKDMSEAKNLLRSNKGKEFYGHVFKMMQTYLGTRFSIPPEGITEQIVDDVIKHKIDNEDITEKIRGIFSDCYLGGYTQLEADKADMKETLVKLKDVINYLNSKRTI